MKTHAAFGVFLALSIALIGGASAPRVLRAAKPSGEPPAAAAAAAVPMTNAVYPEPIASWTDADKERQRAAARALMADVKRAVAARATAFTVPPGDYRFGSPDLPNFTLTASDLSIEAKGATFWFNGRLRADGVNLQHCRNVTLRGLTIDFDPFPYTQGELIKIDPSSKTVDIRLDPGFPIPDDSWTRRIGSIKTIFFSPSGLQRESRLDWVKKLEPHPGSRVFTVHFVQGWIFPSPSGITVGDRLVLPDRSMRHAVLSNECEATTLEDITIYAAPQMALVETGGAGGNIYRRCRVVRRPGTGRMLTTNADVFHSIGVVKGPLIEHCEFADCGDDMINIHNYLSMVYEPRSAAQIVIMNDFVRDIAPGVELKFYDVGTLKPHGTARVTHVTESTDPAMIAAARAMPGDLRARGDRVIDFSPQRSYLLTVDLDRPIPAQKYDFVGCDAAAASGTIIRRNYFHDGIGRGALLRCPNAIVENNRFEWLGIAGIEVAAECGDREGPLPHDVTVRDNTLTDCGTFLTSRTAWGKHLGAITVFDEADKALSPYPLSTNIVIENNRIVRPGVCGIFALNVRDSRISGNTIVNPVSREPFGIGGDMGLDNPAYAIYVDAAENVGIRDNTVDSPSSYCRGDIKLGALTKDCTVKPTLHTSAKESDRNNRIHLSKNAKSPIASAAPNGIVN